METAADIMAKFGRHAWIMAAQALAARGIEPDVAEALFAELSARAKTTYVQPVMLAACAIGAARYDDALALLGAAVDVGDPLLALVIGHWPILDPLRHRPEFTAILRRIGWERPPGAGRRPPTPASR